MVPLDLGESIALLRLASAVEHFETRERWGAQIIVGRQAAPARVCEVRDTAVVHDPLGAGCDRRKLLARLGQLVNAECQHLGLEWRAIELRGELTRRDHHHRRGLSDGQSPMIGDRQYVTAGLLVVRDELVDRRSAVRLVGMAVQLATQPFARSLKGIHTCDRSMLTAQSVIALVGSASSVARRVSALYASALWRRKSRTKKRSSVRAPTSLPAKLGT